MTKKTTNINSFDPSLRPVLERSEEAMDVLDSLTKNNNAVITESIFKDKLLPTLVNRSGTQRLDAWQDIAGHTMRAIDVIDNQTGELLFTVPAILRSYEGPTLDLNGASVSEIITVANQKYKVIPNLGTRHIDEYLTKRVKEIPANLQDVMTWSNILVRYGHEPLFKVDNIGDLTPDKKDTSKDIEVIGFSSL